MHWQLGYFEPVCAFSVGHDIHTFAVGTYVAVVLVQTQSGYVPVALEGHVGFDNTCPTQSAMSEMFVPVAPVADIQVVIFALHALIAILMLVGFKVL